MKNQLSLLLAIAAIFGFAHQANASDSTDTGRVSAVVELTDGELQSLLQTGTFKMSIPLRLKNKVNSLILKRPDRFKDDVAVLFNDVDKRSNTIAIHVDDSTIDQIAYQPVELKIYESGYTNIMVRYTPGNGAKVKKPSKTDSIELRFQLNSGKSIIGRLSYMTQFPLKSGLGKVKVKLDEISQITFDEDGDVSVVMLNGDMLNGESNFSSVIVNSRWGQERIKTKDIASITPALSKASSVRNNIIPNRPLISAPLGQAVQGYAVPVLPPPINHTVYGQPYPQHQFPMATGRIDTVPRSPRHGQSYIMGQPMMQYNSYGIYGQTLMPSQHGMISGSLPYGTYQMNQVPTNHVPISQTPVINSRIGQPLPMMTPSQAKENWFFPGN